MAVVATESGAPNLQLRYRPTPSAYGQRLALVFGNHAARGECPFFTALRCHHCDIGAGEGTAFDVERNRRRLAWFESHYLNEWPSIAHLVVYNSGSVLNPREMPCEFLQEILAFARKQPSIKVASFDSRESFVTTRRVRGMAEQLRDDQCARIIIGIESADDHIRNELLQKQMSRESIERAFRAVAEVETQIGPRRAGVDVNIVVGGPGTTTHSTPLDAAQTARFALGCSDAPVDFNLHPYYPSRRGLLRFPTHSRCSPSVLVQAARAIVAECRARDSQSRIFIGLNDEGHDTEHAHEKSDASGWMEAVRQFNETQNVDALAHCETE